MNRALLISLLLAAILLPGCSGNDDSTADTVQPNDAQYTQDKLSTDLTDLQQLEADKVPVDVTLLHSESILGNVYDLWTGVSFRDGLNG